MMKKTNKQKLLLTLALGASMAFSIGIIGIDSGELNVNAEISVDETTKIASEGFYMSAGAQVRRVNGEAGIRWETNVTDEFVSYLEENYAGATVEYRTLITAVNQLGDGQTLTDITVENAEALLCNDTKGTLTGGVYYGSVLYTPETVGAWDDLTQAQWNTIYEAELIARSYIKITPTSGSEVIVYAQAEDTARSMRGVANAALIEKDDSLLTKYVGEVTEQDKNAGVYDPDEADEKAELTVKLNNGTYDAYVGAKLVGEVTVEDNVAVINVSGVTDGEQTLSLFDANANVYRAPFIKATKVLKEADDLAMFNLNNAYGVAPTAEFGGYYVLGNDIDAADYTHTSIGYTDTGTAYSGVGLTGTFNGMGYMISNLTFAGNATQYNAETDGTGDSKFKAMDYSLFGLVCGGTIKNVGFVNVAFDVASGVNMADRATLATQLCDATVENVYIQVSGLGYGQGSFNSVPSGVASTINANTVMTNCIFDIYDDGTVQEWAAKTHSDGEFYYIKPGFGALSADGGKYLNNTYSDVTDRNWTNVYVVSPLALSHESASGTHFEWYGANLNKTESATSHSFLKYENVTQYLSHEDMIAADIDYEKLGFTADKGWRIEDGYVPTWKGVVLNKTVNYTVNLDDEKTQLSEDDLYALFGNKTATLVSVSTSDSTYGISYTGGVLAVTGAAWNGETFTAVFSDGQFNVTATVRLCTNVITTASELSVFCLDNTDYATLATLKAAEKIPSKVVNGYYVLGNDIDVVAENWAMPTHGLISTTYNTTATGTGYVGFQGTFDGCGYTISNLVLGTDQGDRKDANGNYLYDNDIRTSSWNSNTYSLFGILGEKATVKNVAITNVSFMLHNTQNGSKLSMNSAICSALATWICPKATVENVYVSVKGVTAGGNVANTTVAAVAYGIYSGAKLNNIVVDYTYSGDDVTVMTKTSSLVGRKANESSVTEITNWTNVYVLSEKALASDSSNLLCAGNDTTSSGAKVTYLYQYADAEAWQAAQENTATANDFASFENSAYWDISTGVPVWK